METNDNRMKKSMKSLCFVLFIIYLIFLGYFTLLDSRFGRRDIRCRSVCIIPMETIFHYIFHSSNLRDMIVNIAGNIAAFVPIGFLLPVCFRKMNSFMKVLITVLFTTILIESLQYITAVGVTDIDDVLLNTFGGTLGYILYRIVIRFVHKDKWVGGTSKNIRTGYPEISDM
ncbi:MAG: VanZ family protein [Thermoclostridium sp.]|nr:VanZ family protein [Thermoclostridium sp.]